MSRSHPWAGRCGSVLRDPRVVATELIVDSHGWTAIKSARCGQRRQGRASFVDSADKAARSAQLCVHVAARFLSDVPGFMVGTRGSRASSARREMIARSAKPLCRVVRRGARASLARTVCDNGPGFDPDATCFRRRRSRSWGRRRPSTPSTNKIAALETENSGQFILQMREDYEQDIDVMAGLGLVVDAVISWRTCAGSSALAQARRTSSSHRRHGVAVRPFGPPARGHLPFVGAIGR